MVNPKPFPPVFATNRPAAGGEPAETVAEEVNRLLAGLREHLVEPPNLALATAYLNAQGFDLIADEVTRAPHVRLLLGAEPEEPLRRRIERGEQVAFGDTRARYEAELRAERDLLGFTLEADQAAQNLVEWLQSTDDGTVPRVEVRLYGKGFLHGKAVIAEHPASSAVLAGSANLTLAGLSWNRELNLGYPSGQYTELVVDWFNELWDDAEPYDLAAVYAERWQPHEPWTVFLRMLYELYGDAPSDDVGQRISLPVTDFQRDGILRSLRLLDELGGVLVCDEVGLGKTFIAGEVIRLVSQVNRQKVLVVVPASLKDSTWVPFLRRFDLISARVEVVTFDDLRIGTKPAVRPAALDDYSLVVVDEAHNLRNANTLKAEAVMQLLWHGPPKRVVLMTATPVNNSLADLQTLIGYFVRNDAQFAPAGIPSVSAYIKEAQAQDPETLSPEHLFDLMDRVAVRRTRRFVKHEYPRDTIVDNRGERVPIEFPTPEVSRVTYRLDDAGSELAAAMIRALEVRTDEQLVIRAGPEREPGRLSLARYAPSAYLLEEDLDRFEVMNVGLLRSALLKRLESSTAALTATLGRLIVAHEAFLAGIDHGVVLTGEALKGFVASDIDDLDEFLDGLDEDAADQVAPAGDYDSTALRTDVELDLELLRELHDKAATRLVAGPDAKAVELIGRLEEVAADALRPDPSGLSATDRSKVIVFSTYSDTVTDLHKEVAQAIADADDDAPLAAYKGRLAPPVFGSTGKGDQGERTDTLAGFCPRTAGELTEAGDPVSDDQFDILITTDVLSEGVNLQQAGRMVNFDLPWNPMKLVQRHGRIDRIGSPHKRVHIGCFFPAENLDELLGLEATLQRKIAYANAAIGTGEVLPGQVANPRVEVLLHDETTDLIRGIYDGDATLLIDGGGSGALSGEEYRRRLERALFETYERSRVTGLPMGSGSGFASRRARQAGYVFCARIGDHPTPWFRFVAADPVSWTPAPLPGQEPDAPPTPWIDDDTLTALIVADPGSENAERSVPDAAAQQVYAAWELARDHIHTAWNRLADPANLDAPVEKALREAVELVAVHGSDLEDTERTDLMVRLGGRWQRNVVRAVREIVRNEDTTPRQKVRQLQAFVDDAGLPVPERPRPLPAIRPEDIDVVCWMAVEPAPAG